MTQLSGQAPFLETQNVDVHSRQERLETAAHLDDAAADYDDVAAAGPQHRLRRIVLLPERITTRLCSQNIVFCKRMLTCVQCLRPGTHDNVSGDGTHSNTSALRLQHSVGNGSSNSRIMYTSHNAQMQLTSTSHLQLHAGRHVDQAGRGRGAAPLRRRHRDETHHKVLVLRRGRRYRLRVRPCGHCNKD